MQNGLKPFVGFYSILSIVILFLGIRLLLIKPIKKVHAGPGDKIA